MNFFTYEVVGHNENGATTNRKFNNHFASKCFYESIIEEGKATHVKHIKITNGTEKKVINEYKS